MNRIDQPLWNSIKLSEVIDNSLRLNAGYYNIENKNAKGKLRKSGLEIVPLLSKNGFLKDAYFPKRFKRVYVEKGIPFLGSTEILQVYPKPRKFLSKQIHKHQEELFVKENWVLLSRSGTVGNIAFTTKNFEGIAISEHVIRLIPKNFEDAAFLYIYLKTEPMQKIIFGSQFGSVVPEIDPKEFDKILIPIPPEKIKNEVAKTVKKINKLRVDLIELHKKSNELLHKYLNLKSIQNLTPKYLSKSNLTFEVELGKLENRFDGSYHSPLIKEIEKQIKNSNFTVKTIGNREVSSKTILPGRFKRVYVEKEYGVPFMGGKQILQFDLSRIKHLSKTSHDVRIKKELTLRENMILITSSGTIGNVVLTPKYFDGWTASQHIVRVVPAENVNAGYLYAYLASDYGKELIQKHTFGSVVDEIYDDDVDKILIPIPPKSIMDKIGDPILEANKKLNEAYLLEQTMIKQVEKLVF